jgi:serine protease
MLLACCSPICTPVPGRAALHVLADLDLMNHPLRPASRWLPALALGLLATWLPASQAETGPKPRPLVQPPAQHARVIVEFKSGLSDFRRTALSLHATSGGSAGAMSAAEAVQALQLRASQLGNRVGLALQAGHAVNERMQVVTADGIDSRALVQRLANDPQVAHVVIDGRRMPLRVPNDSYYAQGPAISGSSGGPDAGQWYLRAPLSATLSAGSETNQIIASIDAPAAWDVTTGSSSVIVGVLDTGIRPNHPDLSGKIVAGYDMIDDAQTANDGDGRDSDPSDPGDWLTDAEVNDSHGAFYQCTPKNTDGTYSGEPSSWHGTQTAALIGAATDNGVGIAGLGWNVKIEPIRVLGKCGGYDSDIAAGIEWAVGNSVPGVPANANPVKVLNLSLGGSGYPADSCTGTAYPEAISDALAKGAVVVVSAGNGLDDGGHALNPPANCAGVIAVAGLRHVGTKVGFSDLGPDVTIAAPAGNCVTTSGACIYPIMSATDTGTQGPASSTYTDSFDAGLGTSFSAPLVSGTAALMFSANPSLTPTQVHDILQRSVRVFPFRNAQADSSGAVKACVAPSSTGQLQCYCTASTCGAGMLDAGRAVYAAANNAPIASITVSGTPSPNQPLTLSSTSSTGGSGSIASVEWTLIDGGGIVSGFGASGTDAQANTSTVTVTPSAAGQFSIRLTVTDSAGIEGISERTYTVASAPTPAPTPSPSPSSTGSSSGGGGGGAMSVDWLAALALATLALAVVRRRGSAASARARGR